MAQVAIPIDGDPSAHVSRHEADAEAVLRLRIADCTAEAHDLLLAASVGFDVAVELPAALDAHAGRVSALLGELLDAGLLGLDGEPPPRVRELVLDDTPGHVTRALRTELLERRIGGGAGLGVDDAVRRLARSGVRDPRLAAALERAADEALPTHPRLASELYAEARAAGGDERELAARRVQAAAAAGDLTGATRLLDVLLAHGDVPDAARAVDAGAAIWARRGAYERAADLYRWLGPSRAGRSAPLGAVALAGAGFLADARAMLQVDPPDAPPTDLAVAARLAADGLATSLGTGGLEGLPLLVRAADAMRMSGAVVPLAETPAALAALVALHGGDTTVARHVLDEALDGPAAGDAPRLRLLSAWTAMHEDRLEAATAALRSEDLASLCPRDRFLADALDVAIARRADDIPRLLAAWRRARELLLHVTPDLYALLPLGELVVAAARLREGERLSRHLAAAWALLARLGDPPLWSATLHWSCAQAAILRERPDDLVPHAAALVAAGSSDAVAGVLAEAARAWVRVLSGGADGDDVEAACRALAGIGHAWDGARLAGHAAARASDRRLMARLLACARELRVSPLATDIPRGSDPRETGLSTREREIARLVVEGLTHRQIADAVYVSVRTAEHHVAQLRRRFGASTRAELLAALRTALTEDPDA